MKLTKVQQYILVTAIGLFGLGLFTTTLVLNAKKGPLNTDDVTKMENHTCVLFGTSPYGIEYECPQDFICTVGYRRQCWFRGLEACPTLERPDS